MIITVFMRKSPLGPSGLELTILGTGDAFASHGRFQSGYIIDSPGYRILMEVGPTSLCAMKRMDFKPADIDMVLISHLHGDHFGGMPFLLLDYLYESPRRKPLTIVGPPHLEERTWRLFRIMFPGTKPDLQRLLSKLKFVVVEPGSNVKIGPVRIRAMRTPHMKRDFSLAYRIEMGGKSLAFSGDSGWTEELLPFVAGADLFLCECTYFESTQLDFHMNYPQLDANRARFDVGRMILTHVGREVLEHNGDVKLEMAHDGMRIKV
jgi:ribonuclease BN (tRNA processing enzyme)